MGTGEARGKRERCEKEEVREDGGGGRERGGGRGEREAGEGG